ncbi:serine/threonine protein phosphatase 1 [Paenibacillus phyllosphaerae]|uniref:Serine/threonine protein phosphatase 1 n=1 Tax=Paenibacillus phyllosphaerae TaxID=274593 RepID=A0A7W5ATJ4_9BACL|nr:metallophosphoesterase [Paenibacillus phyllosphaerae]MBB3108294.1 serine/threonine protein phosphatase 1 [Paenibacillus phyllosphaerae]
MSRLFALSDIHGHVEGSKLLLAEAGYTPVLDRLVLVGDYVDQDPSTYEALPFIRELTEGGAMAVTGNMEQALLQHNKLASAGSRLAQYVPFLEQLPYYVELEHYLFVHAGIRPGVPLAQQREDDMIGIRSEFWSRPAAEPYTIVFGHTPTHRIGASPGELWLQEKRLGIDTGAKHGLRLTLVELTERKAYSCSTNPKNRYGDVRTVRW